MIKRFGKSRYIDTWLLRFALEHVEEFDVRVAAFLAEELRRFEVDLKHQATRHPDTEDFYEVYADDVAQVKERFPAILRGSVLLSLYSQFEHFLDRMCDQFATERRVPKAKESHPKDKGILRSQKYLKKMIGLQFPDQTEAWKRLKYVGKIRNRFAHAGGICGDLLRPLVQVDPLLKLNQFDEIRLDPGFLPDAILQMRSFLADLDEALEADWKPIV
jgi:hypothetical protein